ncbi:hypothetical protein PSCICL_26590 [Pseudomonas cichorii]|nr:hypothetical protein PSCICL_26590 [Pseudomonas cichorii]
MICQALRNTPLKPDYEVTYADSETDTPYPAVDGNPVIDGMGIGCICHKHAGSPTGLLGTYRENEDRQPRLHM